MTVEFFHYRIYVGDALVHKMQGTSVCTVAVNFWDRNYLHLDKPKNVALSQVKSLNGLRLDELDCRKLTYENTANTDALKKIEKLRTLAKLNECFKFCNF
jgi:hypothetical protein